MTSIINFISGPGVGKSVMTSLMFANLKMAGYNAEIIPEYAKQLIWTEDYEILNNQYHVSYYQNKLIRALDNKTDIIVTDGCLLHGLVYNMINPDNTSDKDKTKDAILKWFHESNNINIYLERNPNIDYQQEGRQQTQEQAIHVDNLLKFQLFDNNIEYTSFESSDENIPQMLEYVKSKLKS
jgi:hypothetical protein